MAPKIIVNFRISQEEKNLMKNEADKRSVTLSLFLLNLWENFKKRNGIKNDDKK